MKERLHRDGQVQARPKSAPGRTRKEDTMSEELDPTDFEAVISLYNNCNGELEQIRFLLGHASVQTTERYIGS
jgi:hypothetical protein